MGKHNAVASHSALRHGTAGTGRSGFHADGDDAEAGAGHGLGGLDKGGREAADDDDMKVDTVAMFNKVSTRLLPLFFVMVIMCYVDRTSLAFAAIQLNADLGFPPAVYGMGSGLFFLGYSLFQVPSNLLLKRVGGPTWLAVIIFAWGLAASAFAGMKTATHFYVLRLVLGVAEAGAFPGMWYMLTKFFPGDQLAFPFAVVEAGESMRDPLQYYKNVTVNTVNVLDCMAAAGIKQLVYSSTCAVYGNPESLPVTEATPPKPINPYGQSKLMAEEVIRWYARSQPDFKSIILRYFNVYGSDPAGRLGEYPRPELRAQARISGACMDAALGLVPSLTVKGTKHPTKDGTCVRDYIHVMDLISAHVAGMGRLANPPPLYNIGTGRGVSVKEFVDACKKVTGRNIQVIYQEEARPGDYAEVWSDVAKINNELGWRANYTDIEEGLRHAWNWRLEHPDGY
ncbi:hypothetical protein HXX76_011876 [Chlamydomonas incerta]|uniref:NAD-dependent epimerase/dehydratase domain-containing protein n=1 Tax=Chlamydomonas incerta TaxID=51695 RepID=A0A835SYF0_CHLIN|nr:hypothetical protein HXX76_011876 [Chlamydomonas incerta]|eukprot:KAG2428196.1 hypothetical protein HXX76_011876 [Chlamydomonas incerta]